MFFFGLSKFNSPITSTAAMWDSRSVAGKRQRARTLLPGILLALVAITAVVSAPILADGQDAQLRLQRCFVEIAQANKSFSEGRADIANERLLQLTHSCSGVAHLYHNLGAIAALRRDWAQAISYLEQSLALDKRAASTQAGLSGIYQYKAALAYRKALDLSGPLPKPPAIKLQTGDMGNGPVAGPGRLSAPNQDNIEPISGVMPAIVDQPSAEASAVRFEVASWWAQRRKMSPELPPWSDIGISTDFVDTDLTLVQLSFAVRQELLLVLRKTSDRWNVIREKNL